ncbi:MAG: hypothetical protein DLM50_06705 [Candidatus Meridianibacter frigidus]|nr:MAG: hypothetical protein DLM50_06705 [Candidatus Eremiobacteraeota bacterium]
MARLPAVDPAQAEPEAKAVLDRFYAARGNYPNMFRTLAVRPEIMRTAADHMAAVTEGGTVTRRLKELCVLMVSALNDCDY